MKIWEHYSYGETSYVETILEVPSALAAGTFEYLVHGGQASGAYETNLTVATARTSGILDESTFPEQEPPDPGYPPEDTVIGFDNLLPWVQEEITGAFSRAQQDYDTAQERADIFAALEGLPADISDVIEYSQRGLTNETKLLYVVKAQRQNFLDWLEAQPANKVLRHWQGFYADFKLKLVFVIAGNRALQAAEPYSDYGLTPQAWEAL